MYANHSCDPNCLISDEFFIETIKPLKLGDEVTISYDQVSLEDFKAWGDDWDQRWSFPCACGSLKCVGQVDAYRILNFDSNQKQIS
jgi:SET domain-containing protein